MVGGRLAAHHDEVRGAGEALRQPQHAPLRRVRGPQRPHLVHLLARHVVLLVRRLELGRELRGGGSSRCGEVRGGPQQLRQVRLPPRVAPRQELERRVVHRGDAGRRVVHYVAGFGAGAGGGGEEGRVRGDLEGALRAGGGGLVAPL